VAAVDFLLTGPSRRPLVYCDLWLPVAYGTVWRNHLRAGGERDLDAIMSRKA